MNESTIIAGIELLHRLIATLDRSGLVNGAKVYRDAINNLETLANEEADERQHAILIQACYYLTRYYVVGEPDDE